MTEPATSKSRISAARAAVAGFAMGVANVIPGVSGGTMIFIFGVFEELVDAIRTAASIETAKLFFSGKFKAAFARVNWKFLIPLAVGLGIALVSAAKLFTWLLADYPSHTFAGFLGLMIASVIMMSKQVERWNSGAILALILCALVAFGVVNMVPVNTPHSWWMMLIAGAIAVCAMILPGISGSFLLLILGQYTVLWGTVAELPRSLFTADGFSNIFWMGLGGVIGLVAFSHVLNYLFKHRRNITVASLVGFMVGSLPRLWPWNVDTGGASADKSTTFEYALPKEFGGDFWLTTGLIVAGAALVVVTEYVAFRSGRQEAAGQ